MGKSPNGKEGSAIPTATATFKALYPGLAGYTHAHPSTRSAIDPREIETQYADLTLGQTASTNWQHRRSPERPVNC